MKGWSGNVEPAPAQTSLMGTQKLPGVIAAVLRSAQRWFGSCPCLGRRWWAARPTETCAAAPAKVRGVSLPTLWGAGTTGWWSVPQTPARGRSHLSAVPRQERSRRSGDWLLTLLGAFLRKFAGASIPDEGHPSFPPPKSPLLLPPRLDRGFLCSLGPNGRAISGRLKRLSLGQRLNVNQLCHLLARRGSARPRRKRERTKTAKRDQPPAEKWCVGGVSFRPPSPLPRTQAIPAVWCRMAVDRTRDSCRTSRQLDYRKRNLKASR